MSETRVGDPRDIGARLCSANDLQNMGVRSMQQQGETTHGFENDVWVSINWRVLSFHYRHLQEAPGRPDAKCKGCSQGLGSLMEEVKGTGSLDGRSVDQGAGANESGPSAPPRDSGGRDGEGHVQDGQSLPEGVDGEKLLRELFGA